MTVHLFGATSSPGRANFALKAAADDNEENLGRAAAEFVRKDFYVDDGFKSVASVPDAIALIEDTKELCSHQISRKSSKLFQLKIVLRVSRNLIWIKMPFPLNVP